MVEKISVYDNEKIYSLVEKIKLYEKEQNFDLVAKNEDDLNKALKERKPDNSKLEKLTEALKEHKLDKSKLEKLTETLKEDKLDKTKLEKLTEALIKHKQDNSKLQKIDMELNFLLHSQEKSKIRLEEIDNPEYIAASEDKNKKTFRTVKNKINVVNIYPFRGLTVDKTIKGGFNGLE